MSAVGMRARADLRHRVVSLAVLTLAAGLIGGVAMAAFAGARRTDSAYARYRDATDEIEVFVGSCPQGGIFPTVDLDRVAALPEVAEALPIWFANPVGEFVADGKHPLWGHQDPFDGGMIAPTKSGELSFLRVIQGRLPETIDEVALPWSPRLANAGVGDEIVIRMISSEVTGDQLFSGGQLPKEALLPGVRMKVVGVVVTPNGLNGTDNAVVATPAFYDRYHDQAFSCDALAVQLDRGLQDISAFGIGLTRITPGAFSFDTSQEATYVERSTHLRAIVMRLFGWLVLIAGVLVVGQALVRRTVLGSTEDPILRALGMSRRQITGVAMVSGAIVGVGGAAVAVAVAVAASPFAITGLAKFVDPDQGIRIDPSVLIVGVSVIVLLSLVLTGLPAWRSAKARSGAGGAVEFAGSDRPSRIVSLLSGLGLPATATVGARLALEPGHGRTATPVRSAIVGLALTVAAMIAAFGFATSMRHFVDTPVLWGLDFTFGTGSPFSGQVFEKQAIPALTKDPAFSDLSVGNFQNQVFLFSSSADVSVNAWGISPIRGPVTAPTMLEGRWPEGPNEIALGSTTLRQLGVEVGDEVHASGGGHEAAVTIVGVPVFPDFGFGPGFGQGAGLTLEGLQVFYPDTERNLVFGNFAPGTDKHAAAKRLNPILAPMGAAFHPSEPISPGDSSRDAQRSQNVPLVLASLFAITAFASLVHVLLTSVRRRRKDLAILQTIGFRRRQVASTVAWQAATLAVFGLLIGVPAGILIGRLGWSMFADRLGIVPEPVVAWWQVALAIPVTIAVAILISIGPAIAARRTKPAVVLRAE